MLLGYNSCRDWSLLGLWEQIESGQVLLRAERISDITNGAVTDAPKRESCLIMGGPPNILRAQLDSNKHWFTWLDLQNWAMDLEGFETNTELTVRFIAKLVSQLERYSSEHNIGGPKYTVSSWALNVMRARHLSTGLYCHNNEAALAIEQEALFGGRCECFHIGSVPEPVYQLDYRSHYAACYRDYPVPVRLKAVVNQHRQRPLDMDDYIHSSIHECTVLTDEPAYPHRRDGLVIYPVGEFVTYLTGMEFIDALERNRVKQINRSAYYAYAPLLETFADNIYQMRVNADIREDASIARFAKAALCGIVGKLSARQREWIESDLDWSDIQYGEWFGSDNDGNARRFRAIGGIVQYEYTGGFAAEACPAISVTVLSHARYRLLEAIRVAGWEQVYYVDTDCLFVGRKGMERLYEAGYCMEGEFGYLQYKGGPARLEVRGIKHYVYDGKLTCAGMPFSRDSVNAEQKIFARYLTPNEQIGKGNRPECVQVPVMYNRDVKYLHGEVKPNGSVKPFHLDAE
jgi:hypothetical protein